MKNCITFTAACLFLAVSPLLAEEKKPEKVTFKDQVLPIFRAKCGSCHNANDRKGGLVLDDYAAMMEGGSSGTVLEAGDLDASYLWSLVTHESEPKMPPKADKLPEKELALIKRWIEGGLLEHSGSTANIKKKPALAKIEIQPGQRPQHVAVPSSWLGDPAVNPRHRNAVTALACSPWAPLMAVSGHRQVGLYNVQTLQPFGVLPFPEGQPEIIRFSRTGDLLMVGGGRGGASGKVVVFDVATGKRKIEVGAEYDSVLAADISPDQTMIALGGPKKIVRVYSTETGEILFEMKKHTDWITSLAFSPDGVLLATGDRSSGLVVWEAFTGRLFYDLTGHRGAVTDVSWRPDSNVLASGSEDGTIKIWDMNNGRLIKSWNAHGGGTASIEYTREGNIVSTGRDRLAASWKGDGAGIRKFQGMTDIGMEVCYDAESKRIVAGDWTGVIRIWNAEDGKEVGQIDTNPPSLSAQIGKLSSELETAAKEVTAKQQALAALNAKIEQRVKAAQQAQAALAAATKKVQQANGAVQSAQQKLTAAQKGVQAAQAQVNKASADLAKKKADLDKAGQALKAAEAKKEEAPAEYESAVKAQQTAQAAFTAAQQAEAKAKASLTKSQSDLKAAQAALAKSQQAAKAAQTAATQAKAAADKAQAAAKANADEQKAINAAQAALKQAQERAESLKAQLGQFQALQSKATARAG